MAKKKNKILKENNNLIRIDTAAGTIHAHPDENVEICIGNGVYIPVKAGEVIVGNQLAYVREGITNIKGHISLQEIHTLLMDGSQTYATAHQKLHTQFNGNEVPLFQRRLVEAVVDLTENKTLEEKLLSGKELEKTERQETLEALRLLIESYNRSPPYADTTLLGWVQGRDRVLAPEEWEVFETLSQTYPEFSEFTERGDESLHTRWREYVTRRQGVLSQLSRTAKAGTGKSKPSTKKRTDTESKDHINLEVSLAYEKYKDLITKGHTTVEVKAIKKVEKKQQSEETKPKSIMTHGVRKTVTEDIGKVLTPEIQRIIFQGLCNELYIACIRHPSIEESDKLNSGLVPGTLAIILSEELNSRRILEGIHENEIIEGLYKLNGNYFNTKFAEYLKAKKNPRIHGFEGDKQIPRKTRVRLEKEYEQKIRKHPITIQILREYKTGQLENNLKVPKGSFKATIQIMRQLYPAFSEDPTQLLRYSLGSLLYVQRTGRLYQRNLIETLDNEDPTLTLTETLGIPLLTNEKRRVAYFSIDNQPSSMVLVEYENILTPNMRNVQKN